MKEIDGWRIADMGTSLMRDDTTLTPGYDDGSIEVCECVNGYYGYTSRTELSLEVLTELLRVQGYKIIKEEP